MLHVADLGFEVLDLGVEHGDFDALGVGGMVERGDDVRGIRDFGVLGGDRLGGRLQRGRLFQVFLFGLGELAAEDLGLGGEFVGHRRLFHQLGLEQIDRLGLARDVAELGGRLGLELLDGHFEPACGQREFGAQMVLVGLNLGHRHRDGIGEAALGEADRALMDEGNQHDRQQTGDQEATAEIHDHFDHERNSCLPPKSHAGFRAHEPAPNSRLIRQFHDDAAQLRPEPARCPLAIRRRPRTSPEARADDRGQNGFQVDCGVNFK